MEKRLIYSELKEIVYTLSEYEIQQAILKQIHETGHKGLTFEFDYDEGDCLEVIPYIDFDDPLDVDFDDPLALLANYGARRMGCRLP